MSAKRPMNPPPVKHVADIHLNASRPQPIRTDSRPLMIPTYLSSPMETILESLDDHSSQYISTHDLIDAYAVLSSRIRSQADTILQAEQPIPAFAPLIENASSLARALKRDIQRAIIDPARIFRGSPPAGESYFEETPATDHEIQYGRDSSILCHHTLRVLSDIFAFEPLYSMFQVHDLKDLFKDLLKVALMATLPTPNAFKTWSLVFYTFRTQCLPPHIISARKSDLATAVRQAISDAKGNQAKMDGLQTIHNLLKRHPEVFFPSLSSLFPKVLGEILSEDVECRLQAAHGLSGFAVAKLRLLAATDFPHQTVALTTQSFIKKQKACLFILLNSALKSGDTKSACWAIVVLTSMIVLTDSSLFRRPSSVKFYLNSIAPAAIHAHKSIRLLYGPIWRTLIWAFSRLSPDSPSLIPDGEICTRERAFRVVRQELRGGIGISLVTALLHRNNRVGSPSEASYNLVRALSVIEDMNIGKHKSNPHEGLVLLNRVVGAIGSPSLSKDFHDGQWGDNVNPTLGLLDGTLLETDQKRLENVVGSLESVRIDGVPQLREQDLLQNWNTIVDIWISSVERLLQDPASQFPGEIFHIWQSLLLVHANLTPDQVHGQLTATTSFAGRVASIVTRFLVQTDDPNGQVRRITLVKKLWAVMKNIFSSTWLPPPAEIILAASLKLHFSLLDENLTTAWSQLCADLISVGIPTILHLVSTRSESKEGQEVTRQLWIVLARSWQRPDDDVHWEDLVSFLMIPFKSWTMSDHELALWKGTLACAVSSAGTTSISPISVIERIIQRMGEDKLASLTAFPKGVAILTAHMRLSECCIFPTRVLPVIDGTLVSHYPPPPEALAPCLEILIRLGNIISSASPSILVQLICALENSLCCWIEDQKAAMLDSEYNTIVNQLYCPVLDALLLLERSGENLQAISPFITSAFGGLRQPAIGPLAFHDFWRKTYHGLEEYRPFYPDCLKACLLGFADAYGGSIGEGLSMETESLKTRMSTVPDSQPSYHGPPEPPDVGYGVDESCYPNAGDATIFAVPSSPVASSEHALTPTPQKPPTPEPPAKWRKIDPMEARDEEASVTGNIAGEGLFSCPSSHKLPPAGTQIAPLGQKEVTFSTLGLSTPRPTPQEPKSSVSPRRKRSIDFNGEFPSYGCVPVFAHLGLDLRSPKRLKIDPDTGADGGTYADVNTRKRSYSEPFNSRESQSGLDETSQNTDARKRKRLMNWVSVSGIQGDTILRDNEPTKSTPGSSRISSPHRSPSPSSADYSSWEAGGISVEEIAQLRREPDDSDEVVPETDMEDATDLGVDGTEPLRDPEVTDLLVSPSLGSFRRTHQQHRSQTAPSALPTRHPDRPTPLRRNQTMSAQIDALERARTAMETDASQLPTEVLVQAAALANRIQTTVNDQLTRRLQRTGGASGS
ncbi:hypothetical protein Hypma_004793 [Hypsizygus marmoreus]|uniref:Telomere-associated protein Rif1 N-terminal domain-containing protein n=1 Tax=Hypsizygus marmoreus TaxID=39966 RepID=A0A369J8T3_HYPMA|nr:hypothetical protein Hypma_004793 [Hypsizygus marmoreus]